MKLTVITRFSASLFSPWDSMPHRGTLLLQKRCKPLKLPTKFYFMTTLHLNFFIVRYLRDPLPKLTRLESGT
jgi:hypothetical protein